MIPIVYSSIPDPPQMAGLPWYGKDRSLPSYRFVPGLHPHPIRDPKGHSYRTVRAQVHPFWRPEEWPTLEAYLHGVDLFNRFYFWEAHEVWESLWKSHPPDADPAQFIQGLINIAASFLKLHMQEAVSSRKLYGAAAKQLARFREGRWMGLSVAPFLEAVQDYVEPLTDGTSPTLGAKTPSLRLGGRALYKARST